MKSQEERGKCLVNLEIRWELFWRPFVKVSAPTIQRAMAQVTEFCSPSIIPPESHSFEKTASGASFHQYYHRCLVGKAVFPVAKSKCRLCFASCTWCNYILGVCQIDLAEVQIHLIVQFLAAGYLCKKIFVLLPSYSHHSMDGKLPFFILRAWIFTHGCNMGWEWPFPYADDWPRVVSLLGQGVLLKSNP